MLLLALDTATPAVTVALAELAGTPGAARVVPLAEFRTVDARRSGELAAVGIADVLERAGRSARQLAAVAVGLGPGPFTGLRVGIMTAAALADALGIPAYGRCSLDLLASGTAGPLVVATDARRREVYWAAYRDGERIAGPAVNRPAEVPVDGRPVLGPAVELYPELLPGSAGYPSAAELATLVAPSVLARAPGDQLLPLYLRRPDAAPRPAQAPGSPRPAGGSTLRVAPVAP